MTDWKGHVGKERLWDIEAAHQFNVVTQYGELRADQKLLDFGCGCFRAGRLLIPYLDKGNYYGIEANNEVLNYGYDSVLSVDTRKEKEPRTYVDSSFNLALFGDIKFDIILAHSMWTHASLSEIKTMLSTASDALAPTGKMYVTFLEGMDDNDVTGWIYPRYVHYQVETLLLLIRDMGLHVNTLLHKGQHPEYHTWLEITQR